MHIKLLGLVGLRGLQHLGGLRLLYIHSPLAPQHCRLHLQCRQRSFPEIWSQGLGCLCPARSTSAARAVFHHVLKSLRVCSERFLTLVSSCRPCRLALPSPHHHPSTFIQKEYQAQIFSLPNLSPAASDAGSAAFFLLLFFFFRCRHTHTHTSVQFPYGCASVCVCLVEVVSGLCVCGL